MSFLGNLYFFQGIKYTLFFTKIYFPDKVHLWVTQQPVNLSISLHYIMVGTSGDLNVFVEQDISHLLRKCLWLSSLPVPHLEQLRSVLHLTQLKVGLQVQHPRPGDIFSIGVIG